ncbi:hypothetical protein JL720_10625 [Aureococcus anophagefferens]|nr:hypothetical protein JL720_10625 [Aureococcus anophagefferens]
MQLVLALVASAAALAPRTAMDRRTAFKVGTGAAALPFVPAAAQAKVGSKKVVVVGTGFVASYVARDLAKAGASATTVYVSVAISDGPGKFIFGDYMKGKAQAEAAVKRDFGDYMILKPAIITGGRRPPARRACPVPVEAVAAAAVAGALGKKSGVFDGADAIKAALTRRP